MSANLNTDISRRTSSLDGVRGLIAVSVVTLHLFSVFLDTDVPRYEWFARLYKLASYTPVSAFWAGSAVIVFFILSGYALHRMLSAERMIYRSYAARRVIRLWVPYAAAIALAAASITLIGSHKIAGQSDWMNSFLGTQLSSRMLMQHALMIGAFDTTPLDFVIWSLVIEIRVSLVFPVVFWAVDSFQPFRVLFVSVLIGALAVYFKDISYPLAASVLSTLSYQTYFVLGALMSRNEKAIRRWYRSLPKATKVASLLVAATLYCNCFRLSSTYCVMLGSTWLMIVALCSGRAEAVLLRPTVQWLGRISYSLYICHAVVLLSAINFLHPRFSFLAIDLISVPLILLTSVLMYTLVEVPSISLSRAAGKKLQSVQRVECGLQAIDVRSGTRGRDRA